MAEGIHRDSYPTLTSHVSGTIRISDLEYVKACVEINNALGMPLTCIWTFGRIPRWRKILNRIAWWIRSL